jgi:hypothetical protein
MHVLQVLAFLPLALAARLRRLERRVVRRAKAEQATTPERAMPLAHAGKLGDFVNGRLQRAGVLVPAGNDRYYFEATAYAAFRGRRRKRAAIAIALLLIGVALLYLRGDVS